MCCRECIQLASTTHLQSGVKTEELLAVHEGVLAGADPSLHAVANQLDVDI